MKSTIKRYSYSKKKKEELTELIKLHLLLLYITNNFIKI